MKIRTCMGVVGALVLFPINQMHAISENRFKNAESLMDKIEEYQNKNISVLRKVEGVDGNSFILEGGGILNDEVLVIVGADVSDAQRKLVRPGEKLDVEGIIETGEIVNTEKELDRGVGHAIHNRIGRTDRYVIAHKIRPAAE